MFQAPDGKMMNQVPFGFVLTCKLDFQLHDACPDGNKGKIEVVVEGPKKQ